MRTIASQMCSLRAIIVVVWLCCIPIQVWTQVVNGTLEQVAFPPPPAAPCTLDDLGLYLAPPVRPNVLGWSQATKGGSVDYYNACHGTGFGIPYNNMCGTGPNEDQPDGAHYGGALQAGYLGIISSTRCVVVDGATVCTEYREYAQNQLATPLISGSRYRIRFKIAAAQGGVGSSFQGAGIDAYALMNISIVLSSAQIIEPHMGVLTAAPSTNVQIIDLSRPNFWYDPVYPRWITVETEVTITGFAKNYLIIGNRDATLNNANTVQILDVPVPPIPGVNLIYSYNYIDGVSVEEVIDAGCLDCNKYTITATRKTSGPSDKCCYDIKIKNNSTCPISTVTVDRDGAYLDVNLPLGGDPIDPGEERILPMCVDVFSNLGSDNIPLGEERVWNVILKNIAGTTLCNKPIRVSCLCNCTETRQGVDISLVRDASSTDKCCWIVRLTNNRKCVFRDFFQGLKLTPTAPAGNMSVSPLGIMGTPILSLDGTGKITDVKIPATGIMTVQAGASIDMAKICLDAGAVDVSMIVNMATDDDFSGLCNMDWPLTLKCTNSCCDNITLIPRPLGFWDPYPNPSNCCKIIDVMQNATSGCQVYKITVEPPTGSPITLLGGNGVPVTLPTAPNKIKLMMVCSEGGTYTFKFYDQSGALLCAKTYVAPPCTHDWPTGGDPWDGPVRKSGLDKGVKSGEVPNNTTAPRSAVLFDIHGRQVLELQHVSSKEHMKKDILDAGLSNGVYILRIMHTDDTVSDVTLTIP